MRPCTCAQRLDAATLTPLHAVGVAPRVLGTPAQPCPLHTAGEGVLRPRQASLYSWRRPQSLYSLALAAGGGRPPIPWHVRTPLFCNKRAANYTGSPPPPLHYCHSGYDDSAISCILMTKPTTSAGLFTQCVGRGLRTFPGLCMCVCVQLFMHVCWCVQI